jgi:hypothetical protein
VLRKQAQEVAWGPRPWACRFKEYAYPVRNGFVPEGDLRCFGEVNGHEILSRAQSTKDENLIDVSGQVPLCNFHNGWCDTHKELAERIGLRRSLEPND